MRICGNFILITEAESVLPGIKTTNIAKLDARRNRAFTLFSQAEYYYQRIQKGVSVKTGQKKMDTEM